MKIVREIEKDIIQNYIKETIRIRPKYSHEIINEVSEKFGAVDDELNLRERISGNISGLCSMIPSQIIKMNDEKYKLKDESF